MRPKEPLWVEASPDLAKQLIRWTALPGEVYRMGSRVHSPFGYYKVISCSKDEFFFKVLPLREITDQIKAEKISAWLRQQGVFSSCLMEGFPKSDLAFGCVILGYLCINGRFLKREVKELAILGRDLGRMHQICRNCEWSSSIKANSDLFNGKLISRLDHNTVRRNDRIPDKIKNLLLTIDARSLSVLDRSQQVIHGDLNYGNVLYQEREERVVFLDFEESSRSWFSPLADVAFAIERFALTASDDEALELAVAFTKAYFARAEVQFRDGDELGELLRALAVRSFLILSLVADEESDLNYDREWEKFWFLYNQTVTRAPLMKAIVDASHSK